MRESETQMLGASREAVREMHPGDLLNVDWLRELLGQPQVGYLWGQPHEIQPYVCDVVFGDGMQLLTIETINQRPNYHVVRVDSGWDQSNWASGETVGEHIDELISAIEEECGSGRPYDEEDECYEEDADGYPLPMYEWPCIDDCGGCSWGHIRWSWLLKQVPALRARAAQSEITDERV